MKVSDLSLCVFVLRTREISDRALCSEHEEFQASEGLRSVDSRVMKVSDRSLCAEREEFRASQGLRSVFALRTRGIQGV